MTLHGITGTLHKHMQYAVPGCAYARQHAHLICLPQQHISHERTGHAGASRYHLCRFMAFGEHMPVEMVRQYSTAQQRCGR
jgi:hypothetical protein